MGDGRQASIKRVAERAGVSIATVSRVLNGVANKASASTVARVNRAVRELGYRPVSVGRALRQKRSRLVAVLASNLANPVMTAIAASVEKALRVRGLVLVLCDTHDDPKIQDEYLLEMSAQLARATVLLGAVKSAQLRRAVADGRPVIYVNRRCPYGSDQPFIGIDNRAAGADVARAILATGAKNVAVMHGSLTSSATADRVAGFVDCLREMAFPPGRCRVLTEPTTDHLELGYRAIDRLLRDDAAPTALFCLSDLIAFGAHRRLVEAGIDAGASIFGFDGSPLNPWIAPWLRSVRVPYEDFGEAIARTIEEGCPSGKRAIQIFAHQLI
jgi:LacI family transcriptional regulator